LSGRAGAADLRTALARTAGAWLIAMPVALCNLVLVTACGGRAPVGDALFARALPLAASGPGEPLVTAAGVLGLMAVWRAFYTLFLDYWNVTSFGASLNRHQARCLHDFCMGQGEGRGRLWPPAAPPSRRLVLTCHTDMHDMCRRCGRQGARRRLWSPGSARSGCACAA